MIKGLKNHYLCYMEHKSGYFELTWVLVKDKATGYYSAYFAEIPEAIAQGKTQKEAKENLLQIIPFALHDRKEDELSKYKDNAEYKTKSIQIQLRA